MVRVPRKAIIPAAGLGTRLLPASKAVPKELLPVFDRPSIDWVVEEAFEAGIEHVIFVVGRNKSAIEDYFDRSFEIEAVLGGKNKPGLLASTQRMVRVPGCFSYIRQQEPRGLGHAVWCARRLIGEEPFAVLLPDMVSDAKPGLLRQLIDTYAELGGNILAVEKTDDPSSYGIVAPVERVGAAWRIDGMIEKPARADAPSDLMITGRYVLQPEIFAILDDLPPGAGGEIQLTDAMQALMKGQDFFALPYVGQCFDCGDKLGLLAASLRFGLADKILGDKVASLVRSSANGGD